MADAILALNAGSSSIKFALFETGGTDALRLLSKGEIDGIATAPHFSARDASGRTLGERSWAQSEDHAALLTELLRWVERHLGGDRLAAVGHRVVHGGRDFVAPTRITGDVLQALDRLTPLAPLHQPGSLQPVRTLLAMRPNLPQVACFDTAFHRTMPPVAARFALPPEYEAEGVRRYGFHGLSYEYIAGKLRQAAPDLAAGRVIVAHLGNGASLCAVLDGQSVDTTMGFTALDGLVMGTRCGAIDPGVLLYLLEQKGLSPHALEELLYHRSGLLGVSGLSADMRELLGSADPRAREAITLFVYQVARQTAALAASLGGLDAIVFTAGIGEHAPEIRAAVCERLAWLGVQLDPTANAAQARRISTAGSRVAALMLPTDEEAMIARHTRDELANARRQGNIRSDGIT